MTDPAWPFGHLKRGHYSVILTDPPWHFSTYSPKGEDKSPQAHYRTMGMAEIMALPVAHLAARDCALVMWATAPMLPHAIDTMAAWGFTYKTAGAWAKQSSTGARWAFGTGYVFRSAAEFFIVGTRGAPKTLVKNVRNLIVAPVREHSRKPDDLRAAVEALWPGPRCELFAREAPDGWDCWGNQVGKFTPAPLPPAVPAPPPAAPRAEAPPALPSLPLLESLMGTERPSS